MNESSSVKASQAAPAMTPEQHERLAGLMHLLGEPSRLSIVLTCLNTPRCVCDIAAQTGLSPSLVSQHLRLLRAAGVAACERDGKRVIYRVDDAAIGALVESLSAFARRQWP